MDIFECIKGRRSIRSFSNDPISDDDINKILEAIIGSPSTMIGYGTIVLIISFIGFIMPSTFDI